MLHMRSLHLFVCASLVAAAGCGSKNDTAGDDLKMPAQERSATLSFASDADVFLLTVYSTPGIDEASPSSDVLYEIAPGATTAGLTVSRMAPAAALTPARLDQSYWNARLAVEKARRDGIDRLATELTARGETLLRTQPQALRDACSCGTTQTCAPGSSTCVSSLSLSFDGSSRAFQVVGTVTVGGLKVTIVTDDATASPAALESIASDFATAAGVVLQVMGQTDHSGALDVDDSGGITVAFTNNFGSLPASTVGVFVFGDFLDSGKTGATGNHSDILWARSPSATNTDALLIGTLAHEYQHLVSFALRSALGDPTQLRETLWLDEGLAHLMEDLTGWGGSTVDAYAQGLDNWDNTPFAGPNDSVAQRGRAYMLLRYLVDAAAHASGASNAKSSQVNQAAHDVLAPLYTQSRRGWQHALMQDARNDGRVVDWLRAVYATGNVDAPLVTNNKYLPTSTSPNSNGQLIGFNPFGTYVTARAATVPLGGPGGVDESNDAGFTGTVSDSIPSSGARYYLVTGGTGSVTVNLTADNASDINVDAVKVK